MTHFGVTTLYIFVVLFHNISASENLEYLGKPGTSIIEAIYPDNARSSNEIQDQDLIKDSSTTCSKTRDFNLENVLPYYSPENRLQNTPKSDPYLRTALHKGYFYPYSAYMYQVDTLSDSFAKGRPGRNYDRVWYPYTNPDVYTPSNTVAPVMSLPPVFARLQGDSLSSSEQDWISNQNFQRQKRLRQDDDIMEQLKYDSMMKNILPTMPVPYPRDANLQSTNIPYSYAVFPYGMSDCALPILLGCTPKVTYGKTLEDQNLMPIPHIRPHAYRNLLDNKDQVDIKQEKVVKEQY